MDSSAKTRIHYAGVVAGVTFWSRTAISAAVAINIALFG